MATILIVDDELSMREFLTIFLENEGHRAIDTAKAAEAIEIARNEEIDLVISDIRMPEMNGLTLLDSIRKFKGSLPFIMITAYASPEDAVTAMKGGAFDYITKPFKVEEIKEIIASALKTKASPLSSPISGNTFCDIIGASAEMRRIFEVIQRIAPTQANVLISGESGTGKELVARAVHRMSKVSDRAFVPITCSAIPESLFESELFGHVKGSFTGATTSKTGIFAAANNGSAFLDEIGELTPLIQTKLLRVIQEREFKPVGGTETIKIKVRIISATNKDLEQEVLAGNFREDLFYRLAVVPLRVPPLRERKEDIPLLVEHFLKKYAEEFDKQVTDLSSYAMQVLMNYDYPGNVRELENIIERGVAMSSSNIILPESLTLSEHRRTQTNPDFHSSGTDNNYSLAKERGLESVMSDLEREIIINAIEEANGSKMKAAELLGISFRSLRYKAQKYNIS
ncbi:MAG: sigma-54 dependent transcriptional regulator [Deltaproteobacteria bacterium]